MTGSDLFLILIVIGVVSGLVAHYWQRLSPALTPLVALRIRPGWLLALGAWVGVGLRVHGWLGHSYAQHMAQVDPDGDCSGLTFCRPVDLRSLWLFVWGVIAWLTLVVARSWRRRTRGVVSPDISCGPG